MAGSREIIAPEVQRFLQRGTLGEHDATEMAAACDRLVRAETQRSTVSARRMAKRFVRHARQHGGVLLVTALRVTGWTANVSGRYAEAEDAYLEARSLAGTDTVARARIDRILIDTYMYLGRFDESKRRARLAVATFKRLGLIDDAVKTRVNLANVYHRLDRHREADRLYREAVTHFEAQGDDSALARCYYNLANTSVQLFDFAEARRLYLAAAERFSALGFDLYANECRYGGGWLSLLEGEYQTALTELAECELVYRRSGQPRGVVLCQLDRAEALLALNLFTDAASVARDAEKRAGKLGIRYEGSKAALFGAYAAFGLGRTARGKVALARARAGFANEDNKAFEAVTSFTLAQHASGDLRKHLLKARENLARIQLPLWEAICDLHLAATDNIDRNALNRLRRNPAVNSVPHLYALWQTVLGDRAARQKRFDRATACWERAVNVLDALRAKLPPVELRTSFMKGRQDPYRSLVDNRLATDPRDAAVWAERYRTAGLWAPVDPAIAAHPARQQARTSLAELAGQVTVLSKEISEKFDRRTAVGIHHDKAFGRIQRRVRDQLASLERAAATSISQEQLRRAFRIQSQKLPIVQFHFSGRDLIGFIHDGGETRYVRYPDGAPTAARFAAQWRFLIGAESWHDGGRNAGAEADQRRFLQQLGEWLWTPLEIGAGAAQVLVLPEGKISNLPWPALRYQGTALVDRHRLTLSPSLRHFVRASERRATSQTIEIFVGNRDGLQNVSEELAALMSMAPGAVRLHDPCCRDDWPTTGSARVWHYTGHGYLRSDNPFYSSLLLADGPFFAADLRLRTNEVGLVTLAACRTGQQSSLPGEEASGFVRSFLEMGARTVIASHWAIADESSSRWMRAFYREFFRGASPSEAHAKAALSIREKYPSAYHWAAFSLFGSG